ncbi:MAG: large adhesin [uncultured bacterium (gcode 4)]|uniref:Large adhesin n=1 Tax=uncultured bacterium (gcode 4) TaxID=1234023 RepID=K2FWG4_9BACT|nr:MAG: large adhesin [uncultured bacterium (gcode 4)]
MINTKNKLNLHAFTLVELIVVIVILAILATIAFLSFSSQSSSARDSTRLSDISSIKKWMEMYNVWSWLYPDPDYPTSFTYSGWTIWNQWTLWDTAYKLIQKTLSKKVKDPFKDSEYDYSLASNKREYQVAWNFENPTSFEKSYNPFESDFLISQFSILNSPNANALGWTWTNVYISWNYNWIALKVQTWSAYYYVPTPTLFWINPTNQQNIVFNNTFNSWTIILPWINNYANYKSDQIYSTGSDKLWGSDITALMQKLQAAYTWSNISTNQVLEIVSAEGTALTDIWAGLIKNYLGWNAGSKNWSNEWGWSSLPDSNTVLLLHWDNLSNSTAFIDSSASGKTITANWDVNQIGRFWWVGYFGWSTSNLSMNDSQDWNFWTGSFSIDFWLNTKDPNWNILGQWTWNWWSSYHYWIILVTSGWKLRSQWWLWVGSVPSWLYWNIAVADWKWHHVALVRSWNTLGLYVDWVFDNSIDFTWVNIYNDNSVFRIWQSNEVWWPKCYIDELRISKWVARFTWNYALPTAPYTPDANDVLLLHFDWSWNSITDSSTVNQKTLTSNWNVTQYAPKFWNWAMIFDWNWDYLNIIDSNSFDLWLSWEPFTIDFWIKSSSTSNQIFLNRGWWFAWWNGTSGHEYVFWQYLWNTYFQAWNWGALENIMITWDVFSDWNYNHAAVSYDWSTVRVFKNWIIIWTSSTMSFAKPSWATLTRVWESVSSDWFNMNWLLDEFRISKWIARWTENFTPPTSPY